MPKIKFLLDENVHKGLFSFLVKSGYDVKMSPKSIENSEVFELASKEERLLISRDVHLIGEPFASSRHSGIWLLRIPPADLEAQKHAVSNLLEQRTSEELKDRLVVIRSPNEFEFL